MSDLAEKNDTASSISDAGSGSTEDAKTDTPPATPTPAASRDKGGGVDNPAFEPGSAEKPSKDQAQAEAVNLELVDLTPPKIMTASNGGGDDVVDGQTAKEKEAVLGDEFFMPVNEHKKGLRGEKLYVTKDRRGSSSTCYKRFCGAMSVFILLAGIVVAILVGAGVIDPHPKSVTAPLSTKDPRSRLLADENGDPVLAGILHPDAELTSNDIENTSPRQHEFPEGSVSDAYDGEFRITNLAWDERLSDSSSPMFQNLSEKLEKELAEIYPEAEISVMKFRPGSVVVKYRITLPPEAQLSRSDVAQRLLQRLQGEVSGTLSDIYQVDQDSVFAEYVPDMCLDIDCNGGICTFTSNQFECLCPDTMVKGPNGVPCLNTDSSVTSEVGNEMRTKNPSGPFFEWPEKLVPGLDKTAEKTTPSVTEFAEKTTSQMMSSTERSGIIPHDEETIMVVVEEFPTQSLSDSDDFFDGTTESIFQEESLEEFQGRHFGPASDQREETLIEKIHPQTRINTVTSQVEGDKEMPDQAEDAEVQVKVDIVLPNKIGEVAISTEADPMIITSKVVGDNYEVTSDKDLESTENPGWTENKFSSTETELAEPEFDETDSSIDTDVDDDESGNDENTTEAADLEKSVMTEISEARDDLESGDIVEAEENNESEVEEDKLTSTGMVESETTSSHMMKEDATWDEDGEEHTPSTTHEVTSATSPASATLEDIIMRAATKVPLPNDAAERSSVVKGDKDDELITTQASNVINVNIPLSRTVDDSMTPETIEQTIREVVENITKQFEATSHALKEETTTTFASIPTSDLSSTASELTTEPSDATTSAISSSPSVPVITEADENKSEKSSIATATTATNILVSSTPSASTASIVALSPTTEASSTASSTGTSATERSSSAASSSMSTVEEVSTTTETSSTETSSTETSSTETSSTETSSTETFSTETSSTETSPTETSPTETSPTETSPTETSPTKRPSSTISTSTASTVEEVSPTTEFSSTEASTDDSTTGRSPSTTSTSTTNIVGDVSSTTEVSSNEVSIDASTTERSSTTSTSATTIVAEISSTTEVLSTGASIDASTTETSSTTSESTSKIVGEILATTEVSSTEASTEGSSIETSSSMTSTATASIAEEVTLTTEASSAELFTEGLSMESTSTEEGFMVTSLPTSENPPVESSSSTTETSSKEVLMTASNDSSISSPVVTESSTSTSKTSETSSRTSEAVPRRLDVDASNENALSHGEKQLELCSDGFRCGSGECLKKRQRCDQIKDCEDESDESLCDEEKCGSDEFRCSSGLCIADTRRCDGRSDCPNAEDEVGCQSECGDLNGFLCPEDRCLAPGLRCDGVAHCLNSEDEVGCDCGIHEHACVIGGGCVVKEAVCDGKNDCADGSDEWECIRLADEGVLQIRSSEDETSWTAICSNDEWTSDWSSLACAYLGFGGESRVGSVNYSGEVFPLRLNVSISSEETYLQGAVYEGEANCSQVVRLECESQACGQWKSSDILKEKISSGDDLAPGEAQWPSVAYLFNVQTKSSCTVSIIDSRWLLASYQCIVETSADMDPLQWVAFAGPAGPTTAPAVSAETSSNSPDGLAQGTQIKIVRRLVPHPSAHGAPGLYSYDLALVELLQPLDFDGVFVDKVCLGGDDVAEEDECVVAGWKNGQQGDLSFHQYLKKAIMPKTTLDECNSENHYNGLVSNSSVLCVRTVQNEGCEGDIGAPLMCRSSTDTGNWSLRGVLSHEGGCGGRRHPDVYASISAALEWLESTMGRRHD